MSSGFVTENEIEERRKHRQEEWDRVRKEDEPKQVPEEPYDSRWQSQTWNIPWPFPWMKNQMGNLNIHITKHWTFV